MVSPEPWPDRFWLLELRVSRTFLYQLRPQLSGHGYATQRTANISVLARTVSGCLNSAFLGLFYTSCGLSSQAMGLSSGIFHRYAGGAKAESKASWNGRESFEKAAPYHGLQKPNSPTANALPP